MSCTCVVKNQGVFMFSVNVFFDNHISQAKVFFELGQNCGNRDFWLATQPKSHYLFSVANLKSEVCLYYNLERSMLSICTVLELGKLTVVRSI